MFVLKGQPILSAAKSAQAGTTRAEPPLSFRAIKDLAPQKRRLSRLRSDNRLFGVPAGKMSDREKPTPVFPTDRKV
jgi:hypothetical protein